MIQTNQWHSIQKHSSRTSQNLTRYQKSLFLNFFLSPRLQKTTYIFSLFVQSFYTLQENLIWINRSIGRKCDRTADRSSDRSVNTIERPIARLNDPSEVLFLCTLLRHSDVTDRTSDRSKKWTLWSLLLQVEQRSPIERPIDRSSPISPICLGLSSNSCNKHKNSF